MHFDEIAHSKTAQPTWALQQRKLFTFSANQVAMFAYFWNVITVNGLLMRGNLQKTVVAVLGERWNRFFVFNPHVKA